MVVGKPKDRTKRLKKLYRKFMEWMMRTKPYHYLLKHIIPYLRFTTYYTTFTGIKYHIGYKLLRKGDIILTIDRKKLTTLLVPGEFSHAALCVSKDKVFEVAEMTHADYHEATFFDICKESDRVVIIRCDDWYYHYIEKVVAKCKSFKDAIYDVVFSNGVEALYCSELVYESDFERKLNVNLDDLAGLGRPYITPDGLYKAINCTIIWDSDEVK